MSITLKGLVHPKRKISLCFTHPQSILGVCDFLLSDESNRSYIKNCPGPSKPFNGGERVFVVNSSEDVNNKTSLTQLRGVNKGLL